MAYVKYLLLLVIAMSFAFILSLQRMEARQNKLRLAKLQRSISTLRTQEQELHLAIADEIERLQASSMSNTQPISTRDVVFVHPSQDWVLKHHLTQQTRESSDLDRLLQFLFQRNSH